MNPQPSPESPEEGSSRLPAATRTSFEDELGAPGSSGSDASSVTSNVTTVSAAQTNALTGSHANYAPGGDSRPPRPPRTSSMAISNANPSLGSSSTVNLVTERPIAAMPQNDPASRKSTLGRERSEIQRHRSRHHSQGFFEPSLPTASYSDAGLSTSRIAAQAAMQSQHHQQQPTQLPSKRPPTILQEPEDGSAMGTRGAGSNAPSPPPLPPPLTTAPNLGPPPGQAYQNGLLGGNAATTAANVVFPRNQSPGMPAEPAVEQREPKQKSEKSSKKKLFSKPKHIGISRDKDAWKDRGQPSPSKMGFAGGGLSRIVTGSTTTLPDAPQLSVHNNPSLYNLSNTSSTTVVPAEKPAGSEKEKDKEKDKDKDKDKDKAHKHHFLRQKMRLKDRGGDDHRNLPLSSASSNSKPSDPSAPQSLYSFIPASPGTVTTTFGKSVSGLDILHGGRALREKKKEEKALAESEQVDGLGNQATSAGTPAVFPGPSSLGSSTGLLAESALRETLQGFGLNNMTPEDAWDFLKAKLLVIFDGEDVRIAIEDLNKLVLIHIQRCVQKRTPTAIIDDLRELLETGFASLNHNLTGVPDEKLVPHLVQIWMLTFGTILPFIQAVFLPLDLEFKGCGSVMSLREANEFWSTTPERGMSDGRPMGGTLEVRNLVLTAFRNMIIICRYDTLLSTFSRLSLDSINLGNSGLSMTTTKSSSNSGRPGTAASLDAGYGSYSSQSSMLLTAAGSYSSDSVSLDNRSRAASNTSSNPDQLIFQTFSSPAPQRPSIINRTTTDTSHLITETVGRMLQCVSVLASVQTSDDAQEKIEVLNKALKHNWLGRGRTGRDRRGFVGAKIRPAAVARSTSDDSTNVARNGDWELGIMQDRRREMGVQ